MIAVDVGSDQLHAKLRTDPRIELHEKTDIRAVTKLEDKPEIVLIDVSFISLRHILPHIPGLIKPSTMIVAMAKPQFEAGEKQKTGGVIKNAKIRRDILSEFENWLKSNGFVIKAKADSQIAGEKGNLERFYMLKVAKK